MLDSIAADAASTGNPWPGLLVLALLAGAGYVVTTWLWPYAACRKCAGAGRFRSPSGKAWRSCRRCGGGGRRERLLSRALRRGLD